MRSSASTGAAAIISSTGTTLVQQGRRMRNTMYGGIAGSFAGFMVTAIILPIMFFGRRDEGEPGAGFLLQALVFFGINFGGMALGVIVGSRLPIRARPPAPGEDPARRRARQRATSVGAVVGFLGGSFGGFVLFMATKFAFDWKFENFGIDAAIFSASILGAATLSAVLGGNVGNRLYRSS